MPRGPRLDTEGALHHVMVRGLEARNIFLSDKDREDLVKRLTEIAPKTGTGIYDWSLMSNHFHLLLRTGGESISRTMRRILTGYAVSFNRRHKRVGHLFQNQQAYKGKLNRFGYQPEIRRRRLPAHLADRPQTGAQEPKEAGQCDDPAFGRSLQV